MSLTKNKMNWECAANHIPDWIEELDPALSACMSKEDMKLELSLLDRYNELINKEETNSGDGRALYGIENEKEEIINEIVKINEKYREEATKLNDRLK